MTEGDPKPKRKASAVTSGRRLFYEGAPTAIGADDAWCRRLRDLIAIHEADAGGHDDLSEPRKSIIRRAATLTVELECLEAQFATKGGATREQFDAYQRGANTLRRLRPPLSQEEREKMSQLGTVAWFDPVRNFGFLIPDDGGPHLFTHKNYCVELIHDGDRVSFENSPDKKDPARRAATDVKIIERAGAV